MQAPPSKILDKRLYEALWARQLALDTLDANQYAAWQVYGSVDKLYLAIDERIVIWQLVNSKPKIVKTASLVSVATQGKNIFYTLYHNGVYMQITHIPQWVEALKVFLWVPHFNEVRNQPIDWEQPKLPFQATFGLALWQRLNPLKKLSEETFYCTTEKHFLKHWAASTQNAGV